MVATMAEGGVRWGRIGAISGALILLLGGVLALLTTTEAGRRQLIAWLGEPEVPPKGSDPEATSAGLPPAAFDGADANRTRQTVRLEPVAGFTQPTDIQFVPGDPKLMIVLEKTGAAQWYDQATRARGTLLSQEVLTRSEQGLLGLAFHPQFRANGAFFLNFSIRKDGDNYSRVQRFEVPPGSDLRTAKPTAGAILMDVRQPYQNHDAGQLAFGPDGYLYVGWGDGGYADDPHGHGQNGRTMLGSMLRIDVDRAAGGKPYAVPPDNPWVGDPAVLDEAWAIGLRNPWRYTFDPRGRLVVADVGQNAWEEVTFAPRGSNLGWKRMEGFECFPPGDACDKTGLQPPLWVYPHSEGNSITGGFVYTGQRIDALKGRYVFGDFGSGRLWALKLPASESDPATDVLALGRWQLNPSTFGRDADGELYVGDFGRGVVYALRP